ncbi:hypothetical protein MKW92_026874 [Papaver armeniacum]|nr:hypothetical protein MKW92_026874 [Papaver armeniacum]
MVLTIRITNNYQASSASYFHENNSERGWTSWLIPMFVVANIVMFIITMYINDCPKHINDRDRGFSGAKCLARGLGRFSFQPLKENPLFGPSSATLEKLGALQWQKVVHQNQGWRLFSCIWLHAGVIHVLANMLSLVFIGIRLEQQFGFMSSLLFFIRGNISVGASGALFGLLGAMLSELLTNWTIYANKVSFIVFEYYLQLLQSGVHSNVFSSCFYGFAVILQAFRGHESSLIIGYWVYWSFFVSTFTHCILLIVSILSPFQAAALITLIFIIVINLAVGLLPHVDNYAHIGGFLTGLLLGFVLLLRPQFGWMERRNLPADVRVKSKYKVYQWVLCFLGLALLIVGFTVGLVMLFRGENGKRSLQLVSLSQLCENLKMEVRQLIDTETQRCHSLHGILILLVTSLLNLSVGFDCVHPYVVFIV